MDSQQALDSFWNSFSWNAWDENTVPDNALKDYGHYITYSAGWGEFDRPVMLTASLWERSTSWEGVTRKAQEIAAAIGLGGTVIPFTDVLFGRSIPGRLWIKRGSPFYQRMADEDDTVRRIHMNLEVEYFTNL